jgi:predicted RNA-binding protein with TRAM domain
MSRRRRIRREPYSLDVKRYSVYPTRSSGGEERRVPLSPGERVVLKITALDEHGRGVGVYKGFKIIVEDAVPGSRVEAVIVGREGRILRAKLINVLEEG